MDFYSIEHAGKNNICFWKKVPGLGDTSIENFQLFKKIKRKPPNRCRYFVMMGKKKQKARRF